MDSKLELESSIDVIMRQTDYSREVAQQKFLEHEGNTINIIKEFMGIPIHKVVSRTSPSLQQEMFTQIRKQLDLSIKDFNEAQNAKLEQEIIANGGCV